MQISLSSQHYKVSREMISIGDSDWDESDEELLPVVTKPLTNGAAVNGYSEADIRTETRDFYTFEDLQSATIRDNLQLVNIALLRHKYCRVILVEI